jgi:hypothetical protein
MSDTVNVRYMVDDVDAADGRLGISVHGTREMPVWGMASRVSPALYRARTWAIVDYLATLQGK